MGQIVSKKSVDTNKANEQIYNEFVDSMHTILPMFVKQHCVLKRGTCVETEMLLVAFKCFYNTLPGLPPVPTYIHKTIVYNYIVKACMDANVNDITDVDAILVTKMNNTTILVNMELSSFPVSKDIGPHA